MAASISHENNFISSRLSTKAHFPPPSSPFFSNPVKKNFLLPPTQINSHAARLEHPQQARGARPSGLYLKSSAPPIPTMSPLNLVVNIKSHGVMVLSLTPASLSRSQPSQMVSSSPPMRSTLLTLSTATMITRSGSTYLKFEEMYSKTTSLSTAAPRSTGPRMSRPISALLPMTSS